VAEDWRKLNNEELYKLYSSPDVIRNIKSRRMRWTEHVARMGRSSIGKFLSSCRIGDFSRRAQLLEVS
jgi:hypothetical protein